MTLKNIKQADIRFSGVIQAQPSNLLTDPSAILDYLGFVPFILLQDVNSNFLLAAGQIHLAKDISVNATYTNNNYLITEGTTIVGSGNLVGTGVVV